METLSQNTHSMDATEIDEIRFRLGELLEAYNKKLPDGAWRIWWETVFQYQTAEVCLQAMREAVRKCQYTPKPYDLLQIIQEIKRKNPDNEYIYRGGSKLTRYALEHDSGIKASDELQAAWLKYIRMVHGWDLKKHFGGEQVEMSATRAIEIVNAHAKRVGYKLDSRFTLPEE